MKLTLSRQHLFMLLVFTVLLLLFTQSAFASAAQGGGLPYEGWLTKLRQSVTGPVAFSVYNNGIVVAGAVFNFCGELNAFLRSLIFIVLVMSLLVGAQNLMSELFGQGAEITTSAQTLPTTVSPEYTYSPHS